MEKIKSLLLILTIPLTSCFAATMNQHAEMAFERSTCFDDRHLCLDIYPQYTSNVQCFGYAGCVDMSTHVTTGIATFIKATAELEKPLTKGCIVHAVAYPGNSQFQPVEFDYLIAASDGEEYSEPIQHVGDNYYSERNRVEGTPFYQVRQDHYTRIVVKKIIRCE